ncbi:glycosyltransferase [Nodosilinea sp. LEGE 06152]|uniref:glycosyltransferase n=1 Tax=Nodosilinea sp. LEGE 06152 TaxID=2777966 RepID=UPI0018812467|nr:glycosyltransferase [Nodosilinea sp. LEGE 06152]MBE9157905.1 glycosyltransferase [Nodosilinea sp. LEGE 06152]
MKILIIAFYYPPENSWAKIASLRPHAWAKYWSQLGHQIYVITAHRADRPTSGPNPTVLGVPYWPARPTKTMPVPIPESSAAPTTLKFFKPRVLGELRSLLQVTRQTLKLGSFLQTSDFWQVPAYRAALRLHRTVELDLVISTYGPPANHAIAARLRQTTGLFWVADYRDLWHGNSYLPINTALARLEDWRERRCLRHADLVTAVSEGLAEALSTRLHTPVATVENGFDTDDLTAVELYHWPNGKVHLLYTGTVYPGKQNIAPLFAALALLRCQYPNLDQRLEVLLYGWNLAPLAAEAEVDNLGDIVSLGGSRQRSQILSMQASADALVFLDWQDPSAKGILTGKLFEYIFAGKPILGIGATPATAAGQLILDLGVGHPVGNDPTAIADLLAPLLTGHTLPYNPQYDKIEQYTRKNLAHRLLDIMVEAKARSVNP